MRLLIPASLLFAALPFNTAMSQEETVTWYDVEIIVFRQLDARSDETWPPDTGVPVVEGTRPMFPPRDPLSEETEVTTAGLADAISPIHPDAPVPYVPLAENARQLNGIYGSLQRSSRYEPLVHVAWTQPALDRNQSPQMRLTLPGSLEPPPREAELSQESAAPLLGRIADDQRDRAEPAETPDFLEEKEKGPMLARPLDGRVQLSVSRFLHIDLDLLYLPDNINPELLRGVPVASRERSEDEQRRREQRRRDILDALARGDLTLEEAEILTLEPEQRVFEGFRLNQFRRVRSREIHYFDHPVFAAIVTVTPRQVSARMLDTQAPDSMSR